MRGKVLFSILLMCLSAGVTLGAPTPITVVNYSFELPGNGKIIGWDMADGAHYEAGGGAAEVPGWESDGIGINDSGVETGWTPTDGSYTGFLKATDPNVYNLTNFVIGQGDVFQLQVDARNTYQGTYFRLSLYYDNNGKRTTVATSNVAVTTTMQTFSLTFTADTVPACYGHEIGIEFDNTTTVNASWDGIDNVRLNVTSNFYRAMNPYPAHKGFYGGAGLILTWTPGTDLPTSPAPTYRVYFHQDKAKVDSNDASAYKDTRDVNNYDVGAIVQGAIYYWRVDTISGANIYQGSTWRFTTIPQIAYNPDPASGAVKVPVGPVYSGQISPVISWQKGTGAVKGHRVYFSESFDAVNNAAVGSSALPFRAYLSDVNDVNWAPSESGLTPLATSKTYYWRIDTVQSTSPQVIYKGTVWSFTTVPIPGLGFITREVWEGISGTAVTDLTGNANYPDNPTTTNYPTSFDAPRRTGMTDYGTRIHGWLYVEDTNDYTFWLDADDTGELWLDDELILSGSSGYHQWDWAPQSSPIPLEAGNLYYIMLLHKQGSGEDHVGAAWSTIADSNTAQIIPGTSLLPFHMYAMVSAHNPYPANRATDLRINLVLSWKSGDYADKHDVYFGTDFNDVNDATTSTTGIYMVQQSETTYDPGKLAFETTYYWRVDEVNGLNLWKGNVWSFTTGHYFLMDDFEIYDNDCNRVYYTWNDGLSYGAKPDCGVAAYPGNGSNAVVGHDIWSQGSPYYNGTIIETEIVNDGSNQSMPMDYNDAKSPYYSETVRTFATPQDWTLLGVKALRLWFRGLADSVGSLKYDAVNKTYTMTASGADIWNTLDEFHFAYKQLNGDGSIIARVDSITDTDDWAKVGVMMRETLDPNSAHASVFISPTGRVAFQWRTDEGVDMGDPDSSTNTVENAIAMPHWIKLTRVGDVFTALHSFDGNTWEEITPETEGDPTSLTIPMNANTYVGLALTAHNTAATCEAQMSNVSISGTYSPAGAFTTSTDIGIVSNDAEPLYVTVEDAANNSWTVTYPEPNAVQSTDWLQWNIPLTTFSSAGVDLKNVKKMYIGTGNRTNPVSGGTGLLYFDDIRLYIPECVPSMAKPAADLDEDCTVGYLDLQILTDNWLISAYDVTPIAPTNANLVAYYKFDGNFNDSSGENNNGEPNDATIITDLIRGQVANFNGVTSYVNCSNDVSLDITDKVTLSVWVKTRDAGNGEHNPYVSKGDTSYAIKHRPANEIEFFIYESSSWYSAAFPVTSLFNGVWHHLAGTYDGSNVKLYIDGELKEVTAHAGSIASNTENVNIGRDSENTDRLYNGEIDDVRIYSRALSHAEIGSLAGKTAVYSQPLHLLLTPQDSAIDINSDGRISLKDYAVLAQEWLEEIIWP